MTGHVVGAVTEYPWWAEFLIGLGVAIAGALLVAIPRAIAVAGVRADERAEEEQRVVLR